MLRKIERKNKRGQVEFSPIIVIAVIITLILLAPILVRIVGTLTGTFFTQMNTTAPEAVAEASYAVDKVNAFFDYLVIISIFLSVIMLFISAWYIDTQPVFIMIYIVFAIIAFLFLPNLMDAVDRVWLKVEDMSSLDTWESTSLNLTFTDFIRRNMMVFFLIIIVLTGILMYAKFKLVRGEFN